MTPTLPQYNLSITDLLSFIQDCFLDGPTPEEGSISYERLSDEDWIHEEIAIRRICKGHEWDCPNVYTQMPCILCGQGGTYYDKLSKRWACKGCRGTFSIAKGTFLEYAKLPMSAYMKTLWWWQYTGGRVTSAHLAKILRIGQPNAWHIKQRIKKAIEAEEKEITSK